MAILRKRLNRPTPRPQRAFSLRLGAVFACLALLSQLLVSSLPMPTGVMAPWSICSTTQGLPAPHHAPRPDGGTCPVCAAIHLAGITLPANAVAPAIPVPAVWTAPVAIETPALSRGPFLTTRARGPPVMAASLPT